MGCDHKGRVMRLELVKVIQGCNDDKVLWA